VAGRGKLSTNDCWVGAGSNLVVTATPSNHWHFGSWSGDTNGCIMATNKITALMSRPRAIMASFEIDRHTLRIASTRGSPAPAVGIYTNDYGTVLTNQVGKLDTQGTTQFVCTGWTMASNAPLSGTTNAMTMTLTNNAVLTWRWGRTNYWLHVDKSGKGSVSTTDVWIARGTNVPVTATPSNYFFFGGWQGQTNGCGIASNKLTAVMTQARNVLAVFTPDLATNGVPKWWLAQYGLTNFNVDAMKDIDRDGHLTWQEGVAGTDPTNAASVFRFVETWVGPAQDNVLRWPSVADRFYTLSRSSDLMAGKIGFTVLQGASNMSAIPPQNCYTDTVQGVGPYFYRLEVRQ